MASGSSGRTTRNVAPSPGVGVHLDGAAVRLHQPGHDRQPEPGAAPAARRVGAVEPLEHPLAPARRACPGRCRPPRGRPPASRRASRSARRPRPGVRPACACRALLTRLPMTCRRRTSSPVTMKADPLRTDSVISPVAVEDAGVVDGVGGEREQVDGPPGQRALLVEPGQQQQVVDEDAHPRRLVLDPPDQPVELVRRDVAALPVVLGEAPDHAQRGAQLVAGVGDEAAHPLLRLARGRLRLRLGAERRLDLAEHAVQRVAEPADLRTRVGVRHAPGQVAGGDGLGRVLDLDQRRAGSPGRSPRPSPATSTRTMLPTTISTPTSRPAVRPTSLQVRPPRPTYPVPRRARRAPASGRRRTGAATVTESAGVRGQPVRVLRDVGLGLGRRARPAARSSPRSCPSRRGAGRRYWPGDRHLASGVARLGGQRADHACHAVSCRSVGPAGSRASRRRSPR